jgi:hypothetical protein
MEAQGISGPWLQVLILGDMTPPTGIKNSEGGAQPPTLAGAVSISRGGNVAVVLCGIVLDRLEWIMFLITGK